MKYKTIIRYKNKKRILLLSSLILIAAAGGIGYWLWKRNKDKAKESETSADTTLDASTGGSTPTSSSEDKPSNVLAFQQYANAKGWSPKLVEDGQWGAKTKDAWTKFGAEFSKSKGVIPTGYVAGSKLVPRPPLTTGIAYSAKTGKGIGRIKQANFVKDSVTKGWFFANANVPTGPYQVPVPTYVQLQTKEWTKA